MNIIAARFAAVALAAVAAFAPAATPVSAQELSAEFAVAGAPGLAHVVNATGEGRCEATVVSPKAVLASADCVTEDGHILASRDVRVVEGSTTHPVSIVWVHADAKNTNLALLVVDGPLESEAVALDNEILNDTHPALAANVEWAQTIITALQAEEAETTPAKPSMVAVPAKPAPVAPTKPVVTVPAAVNPIRHFQRVER